MPSSYLPILMMLGLATAVATGILILSRLVGGKGSKTNLSPYESGMPLYDPAHKRMSVKFFLVAMIFILFDVEAAFLYPWAVSFKSFVVAGKGTFLFVEMFVFLGLLGLGYVYLWKKGALEWER